LQGCGTIGNISLHSGKGGISVPSDPTKPLEPFFWTVKVRFGDVDPAGVVYYPRFMHYFHVAFEEFMEERVRIPYDDLVEKERIGFPTVRVDAEFTGPVKHGDELSMRVWTSRIGGASVAFEFEAFKGDDSVAKARLTKVALDLSRWKPIMIPKKIRAILERYLEAA
jgi:4-hydroxybenzoyl-CoA thioesterase